MMKQKTGPRGRSSEKVVKDIRRATRKRRSPEEKIRIVLEGLRGEESIAELCRREGMVESLYSDISQITLKSKPIVVKSRHRWKEFRSAVIRQPRFDDLAVVGSPFGQICRHKEHLSCLFHLAVNFLGLRRDGASA